MVSLPVYDKTGKKVGSLNVDLEKLSPKVSKQLLHDAVVMYQANQRQGTRGTKSRGMVAGSTKKMYRQKGTGRARAGSRRSPIRTGGGHAFAIQTRDFSYRLPKKALRLATRMAISGKIQNEQLVVIDELKMAEPRTRDVAEILAALKLNGHSTVIATENYDVNVYKSARNIDRVSIAPVNDLNAYIVMRPQRMLITRSALESLVADSAG